MYIYIYSYDYRMRMYLYRLCISVSVLTIDSARVYNQVGVVFSTERRIGLTLS